MRGDRLEELDGDARQRDDTRRRVEPADQHQNSRREDRRRAIRTTIPNRRAWQPKASSTSAPGPIASTTRRARTTTRSSAPKSAAGTPNRAAAYESRASSGPVTTSANICVHYKVPETGAERARPRRSKGATATLNSTPNQPTPSRDRAGDRGDGGAHHRVEEQAGIEQRRHAPRHGVGERVER